MLTEQSLCVRHLQGSGVGTATDCKQQRKVIGTSVNAGYES